MITSEPVSLVTLAVSRENTRGRHGGAWRAKLKSEAPL